MASADEAPIAGRPVAATRLVLGVAILGVLGFAYVEGGDRNAVCRRSLSTSSGCSPR